MDLLSLGGGLGSLTPPSAVCDSVSIKCHCIRDEDAPPFPPASLLLITSEIPQSKGLINISVWAVGSCLRPQLRRAAGLRPFTLLKRLLSLLVFVLRSTLAIRDLNS